MIETYPRRLEEEVVEQRLGEFGLGERNERGNKWVEWYESKEQVDMNTWFKNHVRHRYTW